MSFARLLPVPFLVGLAVACSSSSSTSTPTEAGADAKVDATGATCSTVSDCPVNTAAKCATVCADGSNPCSNACVAGFCVERGCGDAGLAHDGGDGATGACSTVSDCPVNTGASCATVCADGSNPCVNACVAGQCVERGCGDAGPTSPDAGNSPACPPASNPLPTTLDGQACTPIGLACSYPGLGTAGPDGGFGAAGLHCTACGSPGTSPCSDAGADAGASDAGAGTWVLTQ